MTYFAKIIIGYGYLTFFDQFVPSIEKEKSDYNFFAFNSKLHMYHAVKSSQPQNCTVIELISEHIL